MKFQIHLGDAREVLERLSDNSIEALVTDPPAGIGFMGKDWDHHKGGRDSWIAWLTAIMLEVFRVMKPGAHGLVWAIPRTSHWTATALENAGFEVRDRVSHLFGSGFPKSLDVSKAIDKAAGAERSVIGDNPNHRRAANGSVHQTGTMCGQPHVGTGSITAPATDAAREWSGWGTALKPAVEDWWLVRKPISEKTVAANVLKWSTGALNIGACRIRSGDDQGGSGKKSLKVEDGARDFDRHLPDLLQEIQGSETRCREDKDKDVWPGLPIQGDERPEEPPLDGRSIHRHTRLCSHQDAERISARAQSRDGGEAGPTVIANRDRSPQKRAEVGQSPGEPGANLKSREAHHGAPLPTLPENRAPAPPLGRFPSHLVLSCECQGDQHDLETCAVGMLDAQSGASPSRFFFVAKDNESTIKHGECVDKSSANSANPNSWQPSGRGDFAQRLVAIAACLEVAQSNATSQKSEPGARAFAGSRIAYVAKASRAERNAGLEGMPERPCGMMEDDNYPIKTGSGNLRDTRRQNHHPTVKPTKLMRYLCRLITPPGGTILDPFMGSGSTGVAAIAEGFEFIGIEREPEYLEIAKRRIEHSEASCPPS